MARFRGTIQGRRGEASRLGGTSSGLTVTANGWHIGARVSLDGRLDEDEITITLTGGSTGDLREICLGSWTRRTIENLAKKRA